MVGIKDDKDLWVPGVIHTAVIQVHKASIFWRRPHVFWITADIVTSQYTSKKHDFIWSMQMRLQVHTMNLKSISMLHALFAEMAGIWRISCKIGPFPIQNIENLITFLPWQLDYQSIAIKMMKNGSSFMFISNPFFVINCYIMTIWPNIFSMNILADFLMINMALLGIPSPCSLALPASCDNYIPYYILNYTCHKSRAVLNSSQVNIRHASQSTHYREHLMLHW